MPNLSGSLSEVIFSSVGDYTALSSFTTEANLTAGGARPILPSNFLGARQSGLGHTLKVHASGVVSSTGTPTFQWHIGIHTSTTWAAGTHLAQTTTATTQNGISNAHWWLEAYITVSTITGFGAITLTCNGMLWCPAGLASPFAYAMAPTIGSPATWTVGSLDSATPYYLSLAATCGTSNASNSVQCKRLVLYGLN